MIKGEMKQLRILTSALILRGTKIILINRRKSPKYSEKKPQVLSVRTAKIIALTQSQEWNTKICKGGRCNKKCEKNKSKKFLKMALQKICRFGDQKSSFHGFLKHSVDWWFACSPLTNFCECDTQGKFYLIPALADSTVLLLTYVDKLILPIRVSNSWILSASKFQTLMDLIC